MSRQPSISRLMSQAKRQGMSLRVTLPTGMIIEALTTDESGRPIPVQNEWDVVLSDGKLAN